MKVSREYFVSAKRKEHPVMTLVTYYFSMRTH